MGVTQGLFQGFRITNYYRYLLYLCGIILILSLFLDVKVVDANFVRQSAFWITIVALGIWFLENVLGNVDRMLYAHYKRQRDTLDSNMNTYHEISYTFAVISYSTQFFAWLILFFRFFY